jgi:hypothetical protein
MLGSAPPRTIKVRDGGVNKSSSGDVDITTDDDEESSHHSSDKTECLSSSDHDADSSKITTQKKSQIVPKITTQKKSQIVPKTKMARCRRGQQFQQALVLGTTLQLLRLHHQNRTG